MFIRSQQNPIIRPKYGLFWLSQKTYNPTVVNYKNKIYLIFRAIDDSSISRLGIAQSSDGEKFNIVNDFLLGPDHDFESFGLEDPRVTQVNDIFYLTYTAYDGVIARLCLATSKNLKTWRKHGPMLPEWRLHKAGGFDVPTDIARVNSKSSRWVKAGAIFPEIINNKFFMSFGDSAIWITTSDDGLNWKKPTSPLLLPRDKSFFDNYHLEMGPPPIKTPFGWLLLYHGINTSLKYQLGFCLLDINDPSKIIYRHNAPILSPEEPYEIHGTIDITGDTRPQVIFCCGAIVQNNYLKIYYGTGDRYICQAQIEWNLFLDFIGGSL